MESNDPILKAIHRKMSPLQKTAMVAGMHSTHDSDGGLTEEEIMEELMSKQGGEPVDTSGLLGPISRRLKEAKKK